MRPELREYLDGERPWEELARELRAEATAWDALVGELSRDEPPGAPAWLEDAVMARVDRAEAEGAGVLDWLLRPRTVRISPLTGLLAAAGLAGVLFLGGRPFVGPSSPNPGTPVEEIWVEFHLRAPEATSVAVAGDFSGWEAAHPLEDPDGDGVWTGRVPLKPGVHRYMFVVDGGRWVTDPEAHRWVDDGFGSRNAVLAVAPPRSSEL